MISVKFNGCEVYSCLKFNGGELNPNVRWNSPHKDVYVEVEAMITSSDVLLEVILATDAIRHEVTPKCMDLLIPYLPYARQDRICNKGEALSIKAITDIINSLNYDNVTIHDCHSDVGLALLNNTNNIASQHLFTPEKKYDVVISPDAGAMKKTSSFAKYHGIPKVMQALKVRDVTNGKITHTSLLGSVEDVDKILITDDICDGGRTFVELAKVIKDRDYVGILDLHVTHGIFSKGKEELSKYFDNIYATHDWTTFEK